MIQIRPAKERGHANHGWLDSFHTFSFADYYDPAHMGFRTLRVINEDRVQPGKGFATHGHRDMEIVTVVLEGALAHRDSMGNGTEIRPGEVQRMSAGTGVTHSEYNASPSELVHFLQIWILPERAGLEPGYEQKAYPEDARRNEPILVGSRDGRDGAVTIHQDVSLWLVRLDAGARLALPLAPGRHAFVHVARGAAGLNGHALQGGDGAALSDERAVTLAADAPSEILVFDLA
jgi:hypothetical protein